MLTNLAISTGLLAAIIIVAVLVFVFIVWWIVVSNGFKTGEIRIDEACSGIEIALTKRYDVLTKLLDVAKGYAKHEKEVMIETIKMRKGMTVGELNQASADLQKAVNSVYAVAENYPQLKANEQFKQLQISIMDTEEHLQAARRLYNGNVRSYNESIVVFPKSIVANATHRVKREFFTAEEHKLQDVKMDFTM